MVISHLNLNHIWKNTARWETLTHYAQHSEAQFGVVSMSAYVMRNTGAGGGGSVQWLF
jgi:hypothetical protein